jgi:prevent-host-death family protein
MTRKQELAPLPRELSVTLARRRFVDLLRQVERFGTRFILHRRGKPVAAIVPVEDSELIDRFKQAYPPHS